MYNTRGTGLELFKTLKPPFILIGNHTTILDPFLANSFIPHPIHWVASDGNMRNPLMRMLLIKLVGSIPKSKVIPDIETVNWIVEFIRKRKEVVGFYPEGQSSWNGTSVPAFGSGAKLLKLLKVPVVCALSRGSCLTKPRWAYSRRRGEVEINFSVLFEPQELKDLSVEEIDSRLNEAITHDDFAWAQEKRLTFEDPKRAECLELALYACPVCGALHSLNSKGAFLTCSACGFQAEYHSDGSIGGRVQDMETAYSARSSDRSALPGSVLAWDQWQEAHLAGLIRTRFLKEMTRPIFTDEEVTLLRGKRMDTMKRLGRGKLSVSAEGLTFIPSRGDSHRFERSVIDGPSVLKWNFFEFYIGKTVYRAKFRDRCDSGRKYAVALQLLAELSPRTP